MYKNNWPEASNHSCFEHDDLFFCFCWASSNYEITCCLWNQWQQSSWVKREICAGYRFPCTLAVTCFIKQTCTCSTQWRIQTLFYYCMLACHGGCDITTLHQNVSHAVLGRSERLFHSLKCYENFVSFKLFINRYFLFRCFQNDCLNALFATNVGFLLQIQPIFWWQCV